MFRRFPNWIEEILVKELVKRLDVRIVAKSDLILVETLKRICENLIKAKNVVRLLKNFTSTDLIKITLRPQKIIK